MQRYGSVVCLRLSTAYTHLPPGDPNGIAANMLQIKRRRYNKKRKEKIGRGQKQRSSHLNDEMLHNHKLVMMPSANVDSFSFHHGEGPHSDHGRLCYFNCVVAEIKCYPAGGGNAKKDLYAYMDSLVCYFIRIFIVYRITREIKEGK